MHISNTHMIIQTGVFSQIITINEFLKKKKKKEKKKKKRKKRVENLFLSLIIKCVINIQVDIKSALHLTHIAGMVKVSLASCDGRPVHWNT